MASEGDPPPMALLDLLVWRDKEQADHTGPQFMGLPDAWLADPHWFCRRGHVSARVLTGDSGDRCLGCGEAAVLGPPMTEESFKALMREGKVTT